ncbi:hypothetical protein AVEN_40258-1 [Araneus ventricosus]|uniref:Uncharacterized protein n=1 Tax=Araneus ventricosus TaxID=182803 RepID=A0A4Y2IZ51_ARAVE|nr:hypothetical protein AVEN_40258-1 [Araneus ventricosus]
MAESGLDFGEGRFQVRNPIRLKIRRVFGLLQVKSYVRSQPSSRWCGVKIWRSEPAQVLSSSSDRDSKLRGPSQNSPRVLLQNGT